MAVQFIMLTLSLNDEPALWGRYRVSMKLSTFFSIAATVHWSTLTIMVAVQHKKYHFFFYIQNIDKLSPVEMTLKCNK